jgi:hypothetical protein
MGYFFPQVKVFVLTLTKTGWANFWAIFLQTHLVTLMATTANIEWILLINKKIFDG